MTAAEDLLMLPSRRVLLSTDVELRDVDEEYGRPIVFIPGWMASVEFFRHQPSSAARLFPHGVDAATAFPQ